MILFHFRYISPSLRVYVRVCKFTLRFLIPTNTQPPENSPISSHMNRISCAERRNTRATQASPKKKKKKKKLH